MGCKNMSTDMLEWFIILLTNSVTRFTHDVVKSSVLFHQSIILIEKLTNGYIISLGFMSQLSFSNITKSRSSRNYKNFNTFI